MALTEAALDQLEAHVDAGDAADWLEYRLQRRHPGHIHLIQHSVAWQYFPAAVQERTRTLIQIAGSRATEDAPFAWVSVEADDTGLPGAALTLRSWPGDLLCALGRGDFHGSWVDWHA